MNFLLNDRLYHPDPSPSPSWVNIALPSPPLLPISKIFITSLVFDLNDTCISPKSEMIEFSPSPLTEYFFSTKKMKIHYPYCKSYMKESIVKWEKDNLRLPPLIISPNNFKLGILHAHSISLFKFKIKSSFLYKSLSKLYKLFEKLL